MSKELYNKKPPPWGVEYMEGAVDDLCLPNVNNGHETVSVLFRSSHSGCFSDQKDTKLIEVFPKGDTARGLVNLPSVDYSNKSHVSTVHKTIFMSYGYIIYDHNEDTTKIMDKYGNILHIVEKPSQSVSFIILISNCGIINFINLGS